MCAYSYLQICFVGGPVHRPCFSQYLGRRGTTSMNPRYREPSTIIGDARKPLNASHTAVGIQRQRHEIRGEIDGRHGPVSCLTLSGYPLHRVLDDSDMCEFRAYPAIQELAQIFDINLQVAHFVDGMNRRKTDRTPTHRQPWSGHSQSPCGAYAKSPSRSSRSHCGHAPER